MTSTSHIQLGCERGYALATAVTMMALMLMIGLATVSTVDFNSGQTRVTRERESSLALTEGVMFAQAFTLARSWPSAAAPQPDCTSAAAVTRRCPDRNTLSEANSSTPNAAAFRGVDFKTDGSWTTRVRDNFGPLATAYSATPAIRDGALVGTINGVSATCPGPCAYDFNRDNALWVQSRAVVRGEPRNVVALMRLEQIAEAIPQVGITGGAISVTNNGNNRMIDMSGSQIVVRCTPDPAQGNSSTCTQYEANQVTPAPVQGNPDDLMSPSQIERFKERAIIEQTYFATCPPDGALGGKVVFVENCQDPPNYQGVNFQPCSSGSPPLPSGLKTSCVNSIQDPGMLIIRCGRMRFGGQWTYVGLIYFTNGSDGSCATAGQSPATTAQDPVSPVRGTDPPTCSGSSLSNDPHAVMDTQGGFGIWGALAADGNACLYFGSNGFQADFDANVFSNITSFGTVGLVQNTWRELPAGTG